MEDIAKPNPNMGRIIICKTCGHKKEHHAKGMCFNCYRKHAWTPKIIICKNCGKERPHKAKGMCASCHVKIFHYDIIKASNYRKYHNIGLDEYRNATRKCIICNFDKIVELHHLDKNRKNNSKNNLIGLCPNHHKMLHNERFTNEIKAFLKERGYL